MFCYQKKDYLKGNSCNQRAAVAVILAIVIAAIDLPLSGAIFVFFVAILLMGLVVIVALLMATWAQKKHDQKGCFAQNASNNASNEAGGSDIHTLTSPELLAIYVLTITPKAAIASSS